MNQDSWAVREKNIYILLWYVLMEYLRITFPNGQDNFISVAVLHLVKAIFFREGKQKINFEEI